MLTAEYPHIFTIQSPTMKKYLLLLALFCGSIGLRAHQADVSTTMLVEREGGDWQLIVSTALTAFEYEVETHFGKGAYTSPAGFEELVKQHLINTISLRFNGGGQATLTYGRVFLGHETKVAFTVTGVPENMDLIEVVNTAFTDIHRSQGALVVLKQGVERKQFMLNDTNDHTAHLAIDENTLRIVKQAGLSASVAGLSLLTIILLTTLGGVLYLNRRSLLPA